MLRPLRFPAIAILATTTLLSAQTRVIVWCQQDNTLYEHPNGNLSNGAGPALFVGITGQATNPLRRALVQFDVAASVPAGAHIVSAELAIRTIQSTFGGMLDVFGHRVAQAWGEGASVASGAGGAGGPAQPGDATWIHTFTPGSTWTNAGGDFVSSPSLVINTPPFGLAVSTPTSALISDVQSWLDNPGSNHGWLLKTSEALAYVTRKIDSRETGTGIAPFLTVDYLLPGQTGTFGTGCSVGGGTFDYAMTGAAIGGSSINLVQSNGPPNQFAANLLSLGFNPVGFPLLPQCLLYLPIGPSIISHSFVPLDATGGASTPFLVPAGFPGYVIRAQSAAIAATPQGFVLSNAATAYLQ
jgi:hypothetical protein